MSESRRRVAKEAVLVFALALLTPASALAQKAQCVKSYESAQEQRLGNDLLKARETFGECIRQCPSPFKDQCTTWRTEIEKFLSSSRLEFKDPKGARVTPSSVYVDARPVADVAQPLFLMPGEHSIHIEAAGRSFEKTFVTKPEQHDVTARFVLEDEPPKPVALPPPRIAEEPPGSKVPSIVAWSIGGAAAIGSLAFLAYGHLERSDLDKSCSPRCEPARVDAIRTSWWISAGLGAAAVAGGVVGYLLWPKAPVSVGPGSVFATVTF